ncbi:unnamed protein product [Caenorhabditis brenneri]
MSSAAASLESLQYLLQYMDANRRFEISKKCPALHDFEKSVPLKINYLVLTEQSVIINDTTYKIGVIRKYIVGDTPEYVSAINERGGIPHEVDEYGIQDISDFTTLTPGDLEIDRLWRLAPRQENVDVRMRFLEITIQQYEGQGAVGTTLEALAPIIHESSFPLKKLEVNIRSPDDSINPIVRAAEILKIRLIRRNHLRTMSTITNPVVHIRVINLSEQDLGKLVGHWLESQRPVGYMYIFNCSYEPRFAVEMEDILKRLNGVPIDNENVIIPMSAATQLKISYGPFPEFAPRSKWAVKFLTELIEH